MYNDNIYIINGQRGFIQQHRINPILGINPYNNIPYQQNIYQQQPVINYPPTQPRQPQIKAEEGTLIIDEYQPEKGDPIVVQEAIFKGQAVVMGENQKQVINEKEAILISEGYASENCKQWKNIPKMMMTVFKIGQIEIQKITKIKAKFDSSLPHHKIMKITCKNKQFYLGFKPSIFNEWFVRIVWAKLIIQKRQCEQFGRQTMQIRGQIFKKSQIMGQWQPRMVTISYKGLHSYKKGSSSPSLQILKTKQIWTRFQEIKGSGLYLVIKLWYGIIKQQFAVPVNNCLNWLHNFLTLLQQL